MIRIHAGGPNRYYLCRECGAVREDIYQDGAIIEHRWHNPVDTSHRTDCSPNGTLPKSVREEARELLEAPVGEQLGCDQRTLRSAHRRPQGENVGNLPNEHRNRS
jgi:hypothetical protein